jgi:hypothetical protein
MSEQNAARLEGSIKASAGDGNRRPRRNHQACQRRSDLGRFLEDYALYELALPFILEDAEDPDSVISIQSTMAHA